MKDNLNENDDSQFENLDHDFLDSDEILDQQEAQDDEMFANDFKTPQELANEAPPEDTINNDGEGDQEDQGGEGDEGDENDLDLTSEELDKTLSDAEQEELDLINKMGKTNFKSKQEFLAAVKKDEVDQTAQEIQKKSELKTFYDNALAKSPEELVFEDARVKAFNKGENITSEEWREQILEKIETLKDNGSLEYVADAIQERFKNYSKNLGNDIQAHNDSILQKEADQKQTRKQAIENAVTEFYQENDFYGLELDKQDFVNAYKKASRNELIETIKSNPKLAVELQLLVDNKDKLMSAGRKPTYNDGVEDTLNTFQGQKPKQRRKVRNDNNSNKGNLSLIDEFVK